MMQVVIGLIGAIGIWYREELVASGHVWLVMLAAGVAFLGLYTLAEIVWSALPWRKAVVQAAVVEANRLASEFAACALAGSFPPPQGHLARSVQSMFELSDRLDAIGVEVTVTSTDSDDLDKIVKLPPRTGTSYGVSR